MTRPSVGSCSPATMLKIVLLPQPEDPIRLTKRPAGTDSVTWASASNAPPGVANVMLTSSIRSFGEAIAPPSAAAGKLVPPQIVCQEEKLSNIRRARDSASAPRGHTAYNSDHWRDCTQWERTPPRSNPLCAHLLGANI